MQMNMHQRLNRDSNGPKILIVEDDVAMKPLLEYIVQEAHPTATLMWATTQEAADHVLRKKIYENSAFQLVIADVFLPGEKTGIDLWKSFHGYKIPFVMISSLNPVKFHKLLGNTEHAPLYFQKPLDPRECIESLKMLFRF